MQPIVVDTNRGKMAMFTIATNDPNRGEMTAFQMILTRICCTGTASFVTVRSLLERTVRAVEEERLSKRCAEIDFKNRN